jgi:hypothetical protein
VRVVVRVVRVVASSRRARRAKREKAPTALAVGAFSLRLSVRAWPCGTGSPDRRRAP